MDGPSSAASAAGTSTTSQQALDGNFDRFDLERFTRKIWEGDTVYFETICFMEQEDGSIVSGTLLYAPDKILSVRSHNLQTVYEEGKDYTISGNRLVRTENSRIPVFPLSEYQEPTNGNNAWLKITGTDQSLRVNGAGRLVYQVAVCYTHSDGWKGIRPESQIDSLPKTAAKLANKEKLKLAFYGDSIHCGDGGLRAERDPDESRYHDGNGDDKRPFPLYPGLAGNCDEKAPERIRIHRYHPGQPGDRRHHQRLGKAERR